MKSTIRDLLAALLGMALVLVSVAADDVQTLAGKIDAIVEHEMAAKALTGVSVAVIDHGNPVVVKGYGEANAATHVKVDADSKFAIGSVTKQFTCAAILLLAEDGKLALEDKVAHYYPNLFRADEITLLDLMHHVSGYPDYYPLDFVDTRMQREIDPDALIAKYAGGRLDFPPRSNFSYSNTGYILLGRIVEKVSGLRLGEFLQRRIFTPLEMRHTVFDPADLGGDFAKGYRTFGLGAREEAPPEGGGWLGGAGAIRSTASDLVRWDLALADGKLLKPSSWQRMISPVFLSDGRQSEYACGIHVSHQNGFQVVSHTGAVSGFMAANTLVPETRTTVVVLSNSEQPIGTLRKALFDLVTLKSEPIPEVKGPPAAQVAQAVLKQFQSGRLDRGQFGGEFNRFLTGERLSGTVAALKKLGRLVRVELVGRSERGGMEVSTVRFQLKKGTCQSLMYRTPDGQIQEFLISP